MRVGYGGMWCVSGAGDWVGGGLEGSVRNEKLGMAHEAQENSLCKWPSLHPALALRCSWPLPCFFPVKATKPYPPSLASPPPAPTLALRCRWPPPTATHTL